jgi:hypothetical protein
MFTDDPTTPLRVETLLTLLRSLGRRVARNSVNALLQPETLPDHGGNQPQVTVKAALELKLIREDDNGNLFLAASDTRPVRDVVLEALDQEVLGGTEVEDYFALFYAFLLGQPGSTTAGRKTDEWVEEFNRLVFAGETVRDRFNNPKLSGLRRWFRYSGLGWHDAKDAFHCLPAPRLLRRFPELFGKDCRLTGEDFMDRLARCYPELDGGELFRRANPDWDPARKVCTMGLSHALIALHEDGVLRLHCAPDSRGWSIESAEPPYDGKTLRSGRLDEVEWLRPSDEGVAR